MHCAVGPHAGEGQPAAELGAVVTAVAPAVHRPTSARLRARRLDVAVLPVAAKRHDARDQVRIMRRHPDRREAAVRPPRQKMRSGSMEKSRQSGDCLLDFEVGPFAALDLDVEAAPGMKLSVRLAAQCRPIATGEGPSWKWIPPPHL